MIRSRSVRRGHHVRSYGDGRLDFQVLHVGARGTRHQHQRRPRDLPHAGAGGCLSGRAAPNFCRSCLRPWPRRRHHRHVEVSSRSCAEPAAPAAAAPTIPNWPPARSRSAALRDPACRPIARISCRRRTRSMRRSGLAGERAADAPRCRTAITEVHSALTRSLRTSLQQAPRLRRGASTAASALTSPASNSALRCGSGTANPVVPARPGSDVVACKARRVPPSCTFRSSFASQPPGSVPGDIGRNDERNTMRVGTSTPFAMPLPAAPHRLHRREQHLPAPPRTAARAVHRDGPLVPDGAVRHRATTRCSRATPTLGVRRRAHADACSSGCSSPASPTAIPDCWPRPSPRSTCSPAAGRMLGIGAAWYEREHLGARRALPADGGAVRAAGGGAADLPADVERRRRSLRRPALPARRDDQPPPPVSQPRPPILIGGGGERKTLRLVAQYADACNLFAFAPDEIAHKLEQALHAASAATRATTRHGRRTIVFRPRPLR